MADNTTTPDDPLALVRSRRYLGLLVLAAILGVPISAAAYWFLWALNHGRHWLFETLPAALGWTTAPKQSDANAANNTPGSSAAVGGAPVWNPSTGECPPRPGT